MHKSAKVIYPARYIDEGRALVQGTFMVYLYLCVGMDGGTVEILHEEKNKLHQLAAYKNGIGE